MDLPRLQKLLREYAALDRRRGDEGLTPVEYHRWRDLKGRLSDHFSDVPSHGDRRESVRVPTRIRVEFKTEGRVRDAVIRNLSRGGIFIETPFALEVGTKFVLRIHIRSSDKTLDVPARVVSENVGDGFSTQVLGMGVAFEPLTPEQSDQIDELLVSEVTDEDSGSSGSRE